ncbi:MAG: tetratricopeptide repeat protein [Phycisphaerales bacterium]
MEPKRREGDPALIRRIAEALSAAALLLAAGCAPPPPPVDPRAASEAVERAAAQLGMFEFGEAEAILAPIADRAGAPYEVRLGRAIAALNRSDEGAQARAIDLLEGILRDHPDDARAEYCQGLAWLYLGEPAKALPRFRRAAARHPEDPHAAFYAGQCCELQGELDAARDLYRRAAELDPYLRSAWLGLSRVLGRGGREPEAAEALEEFRRQSGNPRSRLAEFKYTRMGALGEAVVMAPAAPVPEPRPSGAPFAAAGPMPIDGVAAAPFEVDDLQPAADLNGDGTLDFVATLLWRAEGVVERRVVWSAPGGRWTMDPGTVDQMRRGRAFWGDLDDDGRVDAAFSAAPARHLTIATGLHASWVRQEAGGRWTEHRFTGGLEPEDSLALMADLDHDGDLDFVFTGDVDTGFLWNLGRPSATEPVAWERRSLAGAMAGARATAADLDRDGDLDLVLWRDDATAQVWLNDRLWSWARDPAFAPFEASRPADVVAFRDGLDGMPVLATLTGGAVGARTDAETWRAARDGWQRASTTSVPAASALFVADIAGSGHANILVRHADAISLLDAHGQPVDRVSDVPARAEPCVVDKRGLVLVAPAAAAGEPPQWMAPGTGRWPMAALWLRGRDDPSQQMRTNVSGIGTSVDARVGGEWVAADALPWRSAGPQALEPVIVGLGASPEASFVRVAWPDAVLQTEPSIGPGQRTITEVQRQISSCPVIFAWDGERHAFVTDCLGVGGLGYLAAVARGADGQPVPTYAPPRPWERVMLGHGAALAPRDGAYEVRLGEPMEEACYLDAARLAAFDVPDGWEMVLDERMGIAGPAPTGEARFFRRASVPVRAVVRRTGVAESDATDAVAVRDGRAADLGPAHRRFIGRLAEDASLEFTFDVPVAAGPGEPALVVDGWVEDPYSSTGFAMWQADALPTVPALEALDPASGAWVTVVADYGYPAGMPRTAVFPVPVAALPEGCRALRLRTSIELYVDHARMAWFEPCPGARRVELPLASAEVAEAGFPHRTTHPQRRPDYDYARRAPLWDCRTQPGAYTAFGPCTPLVAATDDVVAVFGAGEEVRLRFDAAVLAPPTAGTHRAWVLDVDGWCKDMDLLTKDGATLDPLPMRDGSPARTAPAARDAVHRRFNTRWAGGQ